MGYRYTNLFNGFICDLPDASWRVKKGLGCIVITNGEGFILFRFKNNSSVKEMASLILVERSSVSRILGLNLSDPVVNEQGGVLEAVSIDPSHYYWFLSGDYDFYTYIFVFNPIPYESITKIYCSGKICFAVTFAAPLGRMSEYKDLFNGIVKSIGFGKRVLKYRSVDLMCEGIKAYSMEVPVDWSVDYTISLSSKPPIFKVNVLDSNGFPVLESGLLSFTQSVSGMGFMSFGQSSLFYNGVNIPFDFIGEISPEKILTIVLPTVWANYGFPCEVSRVERVKLPKFFMDLKRAFSEHIIGMMSGFSVVVDVGAIYGEYVGDYGVHVDVLFGYNWLKNQLPNVFSEMIYGSFVMIKRPVEKEMLYKSIIDSIVSSFTASLQYTFMSYKFTLNKISRIRRQITNIVMNEIKKEMEHRKNLYNMIRETINQESALFTDSMRKEWEFQTYMANAWSNILGDTVYVKDEATGEIYHIWDEGEVYWINETGENIIALSEEDSLLLEEDLFAKGWRKMSKSYGGFKEQLKPPF